MSLRFLLSPCMMCLLVWFINLLLLTNLSLALSASGFEVVALGFIWQMQRCRVQTLTCFCTVFGTCTPWTHGRGLDSRNRGDSPWRTFTLSLTFNCKNCVHKSSPWSCLHLRHSRLYERSTWWLGFGRLSATRTLHSRDVAWLLMIVGLHITFASPFINATKFAKSGNTPVLSWWWLTLRAHRESTNCGNFSCNFLFFPKRRLTRVKLGMALVAVTHCCRKSPNLRISLPSFTFGHFCNLSRKAVFKNKRVTIPFL